MKRIELTKYGFIRSKEDDFSDDGNRFTCYRVGKVRVSKLVSDGQAYIYASIDDGLLPYETYGKLPHYRYLSDLNGVPVSAITEEDIQKLYEDCISYEREYEDAYNAIEWPTELELISKQRELYEEYLVRYNRINALLQEHLITIMTNCSTYDWGRLKEHMGMFKRRVEDYANLENAKKRYKDRSSFDFVKKDAKAIAEKDYYYDTIMEIIEKYCI